MATTTPLGSTHLAPAASTPVIFVVPEGISEKQQEVLLQTLNRLVTDSPTAHEPLNTTRTVEAGAPSTAAKDAAEKGAAASAAPSNPTEADLDAILNAALDEFAIDNPPDAVPAAAQSSPAAAQSDISLFAETKAAELEYALSIFSMGPMAMLLREKEIPREQVAEKVTAHLVELNGFFEAFLNQPETSLGQWLNKESKTFRYTQMRPFYSSNVMKSRLEACAGDLRLDQRLVREWSAKHSLAISKLTRTQLSVYNEPCDPNPTTCLGNRKITRVIAFFQQFLENAKSKEQADKWLQSQSTSEGYPYPFLTSNEIIAQGHAALGIDQRRIDVWSALFTSVNTKLKDLGLESYLNEKPPVDGQELLATLMSELANQIGDGDAFSAPLKAHLQHFAANPTGFANEEMQKQLAFFTQLDAILSKEGATKEAVIVWLEEQKKTFLLEQFPFVNAKMLLQNKAEITAGDCTGLQTEELNRYLEFYEKCVAKMKAMGLGSYLEAPREVEVPAKLDDMLNMLVQLAGQK
jgi:hypothetical protein